MLAAEEARARLASFTDEQWVTAAERRIKKLPRRLRPLASAFLVEERDGRRFRDRDERARVTGLALDELSVRERGQVFEALHPQLGSLLARLWIDLQQRPYSIGWSRRAFRSPNHTVRTARTRYLRMEDLVLRAGPYAQDAAWFAAWSPHLRFQQAAPTAFGQLFATAVDAGGDTGERVFATLVETLNGQHPIGVFGDHVVTGLLCAARPEGWEHIERLLLAAQRQEGLRQAILERADVGHPDAFRRLLDVILEHDLLRFAAGVRAAAVWLGMPADVEEIPMLTERITFLRSVITDQEACRRALEEGSAWETYVALCGVAMHDVDVALRWCSALRQRPDRDIRAAVLSFLQATSLTVVRPAVVAALADDDIDVAMTAAEQMLHWREDDAALDPFDALWRLAGRLPEKARDGETVGIGTVPVRRDRQPVIRLLVNGCGNRPLDVLLPWLGGMDATTRHIFAMRIERSRRLTPELRAVVFRLLGDRSSIVRDTVAAIASKLDLDVAEAEHVEALLTRTSSDTRRTAIALLANQPAARIAESAARLWATGNAAQRDAASELVQTLPASQREPLAAAWVDDGATDRQRELMGISPVAPVDDRSDHRIEGERSDSDTTGLRDVLPPPTVATSTEVDTGPMSAAAQDPGLGLYRPERRAPVPSPSARPVDDLRGPDAVLHCISALDDLAHEHRDDRVVVGDWRGTREMLLGDVGWYPSPFGQAIRHAAPDDGPGRGLVLADVFVPWWQSRPAELRGEPGIEAMQALTALDVHGLRKLKWGNPTANQLLLPLVAAPVGELRMGGLARHVLSWMLVADADRATVHHCLDALETLYASVPRSMLKRVEKTVDRMTLDTRRWQRDELDWRRLTPRPWIEPLASLRVRRPELFDDDTIARWFLIERFFDEPIAGATRNPVDRRLLLDAHRVGVATDDDVRDALLVPRTGVLAEATRHRRHRFVEQHPRVAELADEMRDRIVAIERGRGELPTAATPAARWIASVHGADLATDLLARLGRSNLVRGWTGGEGREAVYSRLLGVSYPATADTPDTLRKAAKLVMLPDRRLIELAMFAPQWVDLVEATLGWEGLADAVWWFHSHTKDDRWSVSAEVRESWQALSAERSPLSAQDLLDGAVDVDWFRRARATLGHERWQEVHKVAKLASGGSGHRRAQVFAEALTGAIDEAACVVSIRDKRNQDAVRALGLLPLPDDPTDRQAVTLHRYGVMREFERGSAKFGSQRKASERLAVRIGVENLARSAGYVDPQRFIWAVEAAEAGDLADGPISVVEGPVTVTLAVDEEGIADFTVDKAGKTLKNVPAALRKHPEIKELRERKTALTRQATRVRRSLEDAMVRQESFETGDLTALDRHPVLAPMLRLVTFVDGEGRTMAWRAGGWIDLSDAEVTPAGSVRIAHPIDLLASGEWIRWQERIFLEAMRQPFKQVFRELYTPTEAERTTGPGSRRYEGHQLQPRQAMALFDNRGWTNDREVGNVWRVFHQHDITAHVEFLDGFLTPAEVELPAITHVFFTRRSDHDPLPIDAVPAVVFSEAMRDIDLVVSVAHAGGVDPEATASTVEMRAALARETIRLTKLDNVRVDDAHLVIGGRLGEYSIHLGSGVVHRRPGGSVCIIPVAAQRRGRLFLPFADDDPKTAEIMSKLLLLARDDQIKDPSILTQLR